jgi:hypothetical protein
MSLDQLNSFRQEREQQDAEVRKRKAECNYVYFYILPFMLLSNTWLR